MILEMDNYTKIHQFLDYRDEVYEDETKVHQDWYQVFWQTVFK